MNGSDVVYPISGFPINHWNSSSYLNCFGVEYNDNLLNTIFKLGRPLPHLLFDTLTHFGFLTDFNWFKFHNAIVPSEPSHHFIRNIDSNGRNNRSNIIDVYLLFCFFFVSFLWQKFSLNDDMKMVSKQKCIRIVVKKC